MKYLYYTLLILWIAWCSQEATFHATTTRSMGYCYLAGIIVMSFITYTMWL